MDFEHTPDRVETVDPLIASSVGIDEETQKRLAEIEEKFREKNQELEQEKKEEVKRIVRETEGNPSELAKRLSKLTGLSVASNDVE